MTNKRPAFLMIELLMVMGIIVAFMGFYYTQMYIPKQKALLVTEDKKNQVLLKRSINQYIKLAASYNKGLYGVTNTVAQEEFVALEPNSGIPGDGISFQMDKRIIDANRFLNKDLLQAKCNKFGEDGDFYNYKCIGVGMEITILEVEKPNNKFNNIYTNDIPIFKIKKLNRGTLVGNAEFTYMDTYGMFKEKSLRKLDILRKRMEDFNKVSYINEIGNPCSFKGGLDSWDDFNVPWIWKVHSTTNTQGETCLAPEGDEIVCSCPNLQEEDKWSEDATDVLIGSNHKLAGYQKILNNLSLPRTYKYDEVGNPITIIIFAEIDTDAPSALDISQAPPPPSENYEVDPARSINEYKQGEIYVNPANSGAEGDYLSGSRLVFFYD